MMIFINEQFRKRLFKTMITPRKHMASDVSLILDESLLQTDCIWLVGPGYSKADIRDFEEYDRSSDISDLQIALHKETGIPVHIVLEEFVSGTELAIKMLREYPLPWTFSLPQMDIKEKPLEDILLAIYKQYKNIKTVFDE